VSNYSDAAFHVALVVQEESTITTTVAYPKLTISSILKITKMFQNQDSIYRHL